MYLYKLNCLEKSASLTETVELGVFVPYPDEGREAKDQRRPSVLEKRSKGNSCQGYTVAPSWGKLTFSRSKPLDLTFLLKSRVIQINQVPHLQ